MTKKGSGVIEAVCECDEIFSYAEILKAVKGKARRNNVQAVFKMLINQKMIVRCSGIKDASLYLKLKKFKIVKKLCGLTIVVDLPYHLGTERL